MSKIGKFRVCIYREGKGEGFVKREVYIFKNGFLTEFHRLTWLLIPTIAVHYVSLFSSDAAVEELELLHLQVQLSELSK